MEVTGKLIKKLQKEAGTSKAGKAWEKQTVVVDTGGEFNNIIAVSAFGEDKIKHLDKLKEGMAVTILCYHFSNQSNNPEVNSEFVTTDDEMPF